MKFSDDNKRRDQRVKLPYVIKFRSVDSQSHKNWDAVNPINMSKSGICFLTVDMFHEGDEMELLVRSPMLQEERVYKCKVLRSIQSESRPMFYETVVTIEDMDDDAREVYEKLLKIFVEKNK